MTGEELARCDGREGRRACVSVNGKVYDVSASPYWQNGDHEGSHRAGSELTAELAMAPHVRSVIERFPVVGELVEEHHAPARKIPPLLLAVVGAVLLGLCLLLFFR